MIRPEAKPGLVLLAGDLHAFPIKRSDWYVIVAADRGAIHALEQGILPDRVIGDFDSLPREHIEAIERAGVPVKRLPVDKNLTDGEACIEHAISVGADPIVVAGGLGGRFDHVLGNVLLLARIREAGRTGWATDGRQRVYFLEDDLTVPGEPGDLLSLIPLTSVLTGVTLTGARWTLDGDTLYFGSTRGLSNEFVEPRITLTATSGRALVVTTPRRYIS